MGGAKKREGVVGRGGLWWSVAWRGVVGHGGDRFGASPIPGVNS